MRPRKRHATSHRYTHTTSHGIYKMRPRVLKGLNMGYSMRRRMRAQAHARSAMQLRINLIFASRK